MGNWDEAVRALLLARRICPMCKEQNIPGAKPMITEEQNGWLLCASCCHNWKPTQAA